MEHRILVVSDSTGATAEHVLRAALAQFHAAGVQVEVRPQVRTVEAVRAVLDEAAAAGAMVVHTLASTDLRRELYVAASDRRVRAVDLLGNLLSDLSAFLQAPPGGVPGGVRQVFHEDEYRRNSALAFVVKHDDGQRMEDLGLADIILVGVSRTSKTPLSIYLAVRGYFVANVPIVHGMEPPPQLFRVDQRRIVALQVDPGRLVSIRAQRFKAFHQRARSAYASPEQVRQEVAWADAIYRRASWPVVDVSLKSLEEVAADVISLATDLPYHRRRENR